jgi:hypothetical protein
MTDFGVTLLSGVDYHGGLRNERTPSNLISDPVKGAGLEPRAAGHHSIQIETSNFTGNVTIEGTLSKDPKVGPWVSIPLEDGMNGQTVDRLVFVNQKAIVGTPNFVSNNTNHFYSITGQYAWLRANVTNISDGILQSITLAY